MKIQNKKNLVKPVSVSHCTPVYINGRIKAYNLRVFYAGDLSTNTSERRKWRNFIDEHPQMLWDNMDMLKPVINPNLHIPGVSHLTGLFKYHDNDDTSELEYSWCKGLFNLGAERAWQFRLKILASISEDTK